MKHLLFCAIAAFHPIAANAETPLPTKWSGFYGGISVSKYSGDITLLSGGAVINQADMVSETVGGAFAGYNWQKGNWVFGGELAYSNPNQAVSGFPGATLEDVFDVKARVGYATGNALFYGVIGRSWSTFSEALISIDQSGMNYGIGVDYALGKHTILGLEYLNRDLSGGNLASTIKSDADSISVRLGWKF